VRRTRRTIVSHKIAAVGSAVVVLFVVTSLSAHHSISAIFDQATRVAVTGTLTKVDWINPHIMMTVEARSDSGRVDHWTFQSNPPSWYRGVGLARADFVNILGQTVTVEGVRARDGSLSAYMRKIAMPDGTSLELVNSADPK